MFKPVLLALVSLGVKSVMADEEYYHRSHAYIGSKELNWIDPSFKSDYACGPCITRNYVYCKNIATSNDQICCKNYFECPQMFMSDWICST